MADRYRATRWRAAVLISLALVLGACGGDVDDTSGDVDSGSTAEEVGESAGDGTSGDDGESESASSSDDFPIPWPDGLVLDALDAAGVPNDSQRQLYYENEAFDSVVAFYDNWTSESGDWSRGEADGVVAYQRVVGDNDIQSITVAPDHDPGA